MGLHNSSFDDFNNFIRSSQIKMTNNTATYNRVKQELALTKANIYSPESKRAVNNFSGERYISKVSESLYKSFCQVSREPETGCLQEKKIP